MANEKLTDEQLQVLVKFTELVSNSNNDKGECSE